MESSLGNSCFFKNANKQNHVFTNEKLGDQTPFFVLVAVQDKT